MVSGADKKLTLVADPPNPDEQKDWDEGETEDEIDEQNPARSKRQAKKQRQALVEASKVYGSDFIRKLRLVRDPKERIIFVAEYVFARKGFGGARTQEIADLATVNKAMIHYYFDNKDKLYHAVLDKILFDLIKLTQDTSREELPYDKQFEIFFHGFFDYVVTHKNFSRITAMEMGSNDRYLARLVETFFKPLFDRGVAFIKEGISAGEFRKVDPRHFLINIYALTMAYFSDAEFMEKLIGEDPLSKKMIKERREHLLDIVLTTLGCKRS